MMRVYPWNEVDFTKNGLAALINTADVCIERGVNGDCTLSFSLPPNDKVWSFVKEEAIVTLERQRYRIKNIAKTKVTAYPIYQDACGHHMQSTGEYIGKSGYYILQKLFENVNEVKVLSVGEVYALGLEPICGASTGENMAEDLIDFFEQSKVTPIGALKYLQSQLDKYNIHNELYYNNNSIALVKKLGVDRGAKIDLRLNAKNIKPTRDTTELITKLYPYGTGDVHIGSVTKAGYYDVNGKPASSNDYCYRILNDGDQFIVSPYAERYPIHEGHMSFEDTSEPSELLKMAALQLDKSNPDRIDIPKYTVEVENPIKIGVSIALGDIVEVNDPQFNIKTKQRVVKEKYYPYEPHKTSVTVGSPEMSMLEIFSGVITQTTAMTNDSGRIKSSWLENIKSAYRTEINTAFDEVEKEGRPTVIHNYGDIWINPNNNSQALAIIGGRLAIANGKDENDDWNWTAFGDWSGFTADILRSGILQTEMVEIMGSENKMTINDNMIVFKDAKNVKRAEWGLDKNTDEYIFRMYDENGKLKLEMDDTGDVKILGVLDTRKENDEKGINCGYLIENDAIWGMKYDGDIGSYVNHGFYTEENEYGSHLSLYVDGTEHLHVRAYKNEDDEREVALAVNNTSQDPTAEYDPDDPDNPDTLDSWDFLQIKEGRECATSRMCGDWDICSENMSFYTSKKVRLSGAAGLPGMFVSAGTYGYTGSFIVKTGVNGTDFYWKLGFVNGILMSVKDNSQ